MFSFSLNFSYELSEKTRYVLYPLTKGASIVKLPLRLDIAYVLSLIVSGILYLSLCFHNIKILFKTVFKVFSNADNENKGATVVSAPSDEVVENVVEKSVAVGEVAMSEEKVE